MSRPAKATIDLSALRHNLQVVRTLSGSKVVGVIKADAYGHGSIPVARTLEQENIDCLAVSCLEEAVTLRNAGIRCPLLLLEGFFFEDELPLIARYQLSAVIQQEEQIEMLNRWQGDPISIWLKIDTGMHRIGFLPEEFARAYKNLRQCPAVNNITLMTHFASADEPDNLATLNQIGSFEEAVKGLPDPLCLCNSAGIMQWPEAHGDWVRPGIMLYGSSPFAKPHPHDDKLKPVMTLSSSIFAIRNFDRGTAIGYGGGFVTSKPMKVGVVAMGYADGYPRHTPSGAPVLVNGVRSRILGRVSMDMMSVDLTHIANARIGDTVTLWGKGLPATEVAHHAGTISYELFCNLKRVPVHYLDKAGQVTSEPEPVAQTVSTD